MYQTKPDQGALIAHVSKCFGKIHQQLEFYDDDHYYFPDRVIPPENVYHPAIVHQCKALFLNTYNPNVKTYTNSYLMNHGGRPSNVVHLHRDCIRSAKLLRYRLSDIVPEHITYTEFTLEEGRVPYFYKGGMVFTRDKVTGEFVARSPCPAYNEDGTTCSRLSTPWSVACIHHSKSIHRKYLKEVENMRNQRSQVYFRKSPVIAEKLRILSDSSGITDLHEEISLMRLSLSEVLNKVVEKKGEEGLASPAVLELISETTSKLAKVAQVQDKVSARKMGTITIPQLFTILQEAVSWMVSRCDTYDYDSDPKALMLRMLPELPIPQGTIRADDMGLLQAARGAILVPSPPEDSDATIVLEGEWALQPKQDKPSALPEPSEPSDDPSPSDVAND